MNSYLIDKHNLSGDIWSFKFKRPPGFDFIAGQFIELSIRDKDQELHKKWFTISSSPTIKTYISITTRIPNIKSDFKKLLNSINSGDEIGISDSMGDFVLPRDKKVDLAFIAFGIGVTPYLSIFSYLKDIDETRKVSMIYIKGRNDKDILECKLISTMTKELEVLDHNQSINSATNWSIFYKNKDFIYISGPEDKVSETKKILVNAGVPENRVIGDYFPGY